MKKIFILLLCLVFSGCQGMQASEASSLSAPAASQPVLESFSSPASKSSSNSPAGEEAEIPVSQEKEFRFSASEPSLLTEKNPERFTCRYYEIPADREEFDSASLGDGFIVFCVFDSVVSPTITYQILDKNWTVYLFWPETGKVEAFDRDTLVLDCQVYQNKCYWLEISEYLSSNWAIYQLDPATNEITKFYSPENSSWVANRIQRDGKYLVWTDWQNTETEEHLFVHLLDLETKEVITRNLGPDVAPFSTLNIQNGFTAYSEVVNGKHQITVVNLLSGEAVKTVQVADYINKSASVFYRNGRIYLESDLNIHQLDMETGKITPICSYVSDFSFIDNHHLVWTSNDYLFLYDIEQGEIAASKKLEYVGQPASFRQPVVWDGYKTVLCCEGGYDTSEIPDVKLLAELWISEE